MSTSDPANRVPPEQDDRRPTPSAEPFEAAPIEDASGLTANVARPEGAPPRVEVGPTIDFQAVIDAIPHGEEFNAWEILEQHPHLCGRDSMILELAYEEFCRREEAGEVVNQLEFVKQFAPVQHSLIALLRVHGGIGRLLEPHTVRCWPGINDVFLGFELIEQLGRGAMSRVFLARDRGMNDRTVVVKICPQGRHEAECQGILTHENISPIHSIHEETAEQRATRHAAHETPPEAVGNGTQSAIDPMLSAICMPFHGRLTLHGVLDATWSPEKLAGSLSPAATDVIDAIERAGSKGDTITDDNLVRLKASWQDASFTDIAVRLMLQIARALKFTHHHRIVHGDLKPANILLDHNGLARLIDFNLARVDWETDVRFGGTLPYMPTEQLASLVDPQTERPSAADHRSDLFAFGATFYHVLTGDLPFGDIVVKNLSGMDNDGPKRIYAEQLRVGQLTQEQFHKQMQRTNREIPPVLASLIQQCIAPHPERRPESADVVVRVLESIVQPVMPVTALATPVTESRESVRTARLALPLAMIAVAIVVGLLAKTPTASSVQSSQGLISTDSQNSPQIAAPLDQSATRQRAMQLLDANDVAGAADCLQQLADAGDDSPSTIIGQSLCFVESGEFANALEALDRIQDDRFDDYTEMVRQFIRLAAGVDQIIMRRDRGENIAEHTNALRNPEMRLSLVSYWENLAADFPTLVNRNNHACSLLLCGQISEARQVLLKLEATEPDIPAVLLNLAFTELFLSRDEARIPDLHWIRRTVEQERCADSIALSAILHADRARRLVSMDRDAAAAEISMALDFAEQAAGMGAIPGESFFFLREILEPKSMVQRATALLEQRVPTGRFHRTGPTSVLRPSMRELLPDQVVMAR